MTPPGESGSAKGAALLACELVSQGELEGSGLGMRAVEGGIGTPCCVLCQEAIISRFMPTAPHVNSLTCVAGGEVWLQLCDERRPSRNVTYPLEPHAPRERATQGRSGQ
mgnify:CR=1 FL=1